MNTNVPIPQKSKRFSFTLFTRCTALLLAAALVLLPGCQAPPVRNDTETLTYDQRVEDVNYMLDFMDENFIFKGISPGAPDELFEPGSRKREKAVAQMVNVQDDRQFLCGISDFLNSLQGGTPSHTQIPHLLDRPQSWLPDNPLEPEKNRKYWYELWTKPVNSLLPGTILSMDSRNVEKTPVVIHSNIQGVESGDRLISANDKPLPYDLSFLMDKPTLKLKLLKSDGSQQVVNYTGQDMQQKNIHNLKTGFVTKSFQNGAVQYLYLPSIDQSFMTGVDRFFKQAENSKAIVIDVRGNGGGSPILCDRILTYLSDKTYEFEYTVVAQDTPLLNKYVADIPRVPVPIMNNPVFAGKQLFACMGQATLPYVYWGIDAKAFAQKNVDKPYGGRVFILQDEHTFSAAIYLLWILSQGQLATSVGSTTYGNVLTTLDPWIQLPNSGIPVQIEYAANVDADGNMPYMDGIVPDYPVPSTITAQQMSEFYRDNPDAPNMFTSEYDAPFQKCLELIEGAE